MNLTFKGFLRLYCRELTGLQTDNLRKLVNAAATDCPAAAEAVMLFAAAQGKVEYAVNLACGFWMEEDYKLVAGQIAKLGSVEAFLESRDASSRYKKVLLAYLAQTTAIEADRRVIALMRSKTLDALKRSGCSVYGVCRDLGLNKGNIYAYLNKGDVSKVSRNTARSILNFVESLAK